VYTPEFKAECIALIDRDTRTYVQLGRDLGVSAHVLRQWYNTAMAKKGKGGKAAAAKTSKQESAAEKLERLERDNARLQREVETLKMDKEILKKAAAFFARENE
jgi:transposase